MSLPLVSALALIALAAGPPAALASTHGDRLATSRFLRGELRWETTAQADTPAGNAAVGELVAKVRSECPGALATAPDLHDEHRPTKVLVKQAARQGEFSLGLAIATLRSWFSASDGPLEAFVSEALTLRWSDPRLTRLAHAEANAARRFYLGPIPDICADAKSWSSSGYGAVPPDLHALASEFTGHEKVSEVELNRRLGRDENAATRTIAYRVHRLGRQIARALDKPAVSIIVIERALGLPSPIDA
jgi:hypothetical protein